jgi:hypothetical protein
VAICSVLAGCSVADHDEVVLDAGEVVLVVGLSRPNLWK